MHIKRFIQTFQNHSAIIFVIHPKTGEIQGTTRAAQDFYGYTEREFRKLTIFDINTKSKEELMALMQNASNDNENRFIFNHKLKDGEVKEVEVHSSLIELGGQEYIFSIIKDFTEINKLHKKANEEEEKYKEFMAVASDGVHILDMDGNVIHCSYSFASLLGYDYEDALKLNVLDFDNKIPKKQILIAIKELLTEPRTFETVHKRKDGSTFPAQINAKGIKLGGKAYLYASTRDISEQKKLEKELIAARKFAEKASQAKSEFLANMSHEIRTPLNAIIGLTNMTIETAMDNKQYEYVKNIQDASTSLLGIINQILDYSKIEAGKLEISNGPFRLKDCLDHINNLFKFEANKKNIDFSICHNLGDDFTIISDQLRLSQIIINLLGNSFKFTESGNIKLYIEKKSDKQLQFSVTDTGIGIPNELKSKVFRPFEQGDNSRTKRYGGTGLGLRLCHQLTELLGGKIWIEDQNTIGTTFKFEINFQEVKHSPTKEILPSATSQFSTDLYKGKRALLVEDNKLNIMVAQNILQKLGFEVEIAENGEAALNSFKQRSFDIIFMDLHMPIMDGFESTKAIRELDQDIPIIAVSASVMAPEQRMAKKAGMNDHVPKPIKKEYLLEITKNYLPPSKIQKKTINM